LLPPLADEIEVSLFGPGYGEAVAVHLGSGDWLLVDSCLNDDRQPAALAYLKSMGIDPGQAVKLLVASHWHDDHVKGIADVFAASTSATFSCAWAMTQKEFLQIAHQYQASDNSVAGSRTTELVKIINLLEGRPPIKWTGADKVLLASSGRTPYQITSLSPSDLRAQLFLKEIAKLVPVPKETRRAAVDISPNHVASALWVSALGEDILLGSDLEEVADPNCGWSAIVSSTGRPAGKAGVFKVAHHGSLTGHNDDVWSKMLTAQPVAILTPFNKSGGLPRTADVQRILEKTPRGYATARPTSKAAVKRDKAVERMVDSVAISFQRAQPKCGHIQLRKRPGVDATWRVSLDGNACELKQLA
jgi:hypothetical protein